MKPDLQLAEELIKYKTCMGKHVPEYAKEIVRRGYATPSEQNRLRAEHKKFTSTNSTKIKKIKEKS
jgi:hypothetical protein